MISELLEGLSLSPGGVYVDATMGLGGHTEAMLSRCPGIKLVFGLDWDTEAVRQAGLRLRHSCNKVQFINRNFTDLPEVLLSNDMKGVDGILMDLGISSFQLENSGRGFSFSREEPLDMRMDRSGSVTAADMVNRLSAKKLADLIWTYGEERWAKHIAKRIYERRKVTPFLTSTDLASMVANAIPRKCHPRRIHPATKTFQALRIAVNRELDNLRDALELFPACLKPNGRMCVISFHSLEDRLVKHAFREDVRLKPLTKKPIVPSRDETLINPRARSAKMRIAQLVDLS